MKHAWIVAVGFFILAMESGVRQVLNVFAKPMMDHFACSHYTATLLIVVLPNASSLMSGPLVAMFYQTFGARVGICAGSILAGAGFVAGAITPSIYRMTVYSLLIGVGCGMMRNSIFSVQCEYFEPKRRNLVLGFICIGPGLATFIFPRLLVPFMVNHTWQSAFWILAGLYLLCAIMGLFITKQPSCRKTSCSAIFGVGVWKNTGFVFMQLAAFCSSSTAIVYISHTLAWMRKKGISEPEILYSFNGVASIVGRIALTFALKMFDCHIGWLMLLSYAIGQLATPAAVFCDSKLCFGIQNAACGFGFGFYQTCLGPFLVALVGADSFSNALGYTNLINGVAAMSSVDLTSIFVSLFPSIAEAEFIYLAIIAILSVVFSALSFVCMRRREKREVEKVHDLVAFGEEAAVTNSLAPPQIEMVECSTPKSRKHSYLLEEAVASGNGALDTEQLKRLQTVYDENLA